MVGSASGGSAGSGEAAVESGAGGWPEAFGACCASAVAGCGCAVTRRRLRRPWHLGRERRRGHGALSRHGGLRCYGGLGRQGRLRRRRGLCRRGVNRRRLRLRGRGRSRLDRSGGGRGAHSAGREQRSLARFERERLRDLVAQARSVGGCGRSAAARAARPVRPSRKRARLRSSRTGSWQPRFEVAGGSCAGSRSREPPGGY